MTSLLKLIGAIACGAALVACGGGGGDKGDSPLGEGHGTSPFNGGSGGSGGGGGGGGSTTSPTVALALASATVPASGASLKATVKDSAGAVSVGNTVSFSVSGLGALSATSAQTDANGDAVVTLTPASASSYGNDLAIAKTTVGGANVFGFIDYNVSPPSGITSPTLALSLAPSNVTASTKGVVTATLKDGSNQPIANAMVTFRTAVAGIGSLNPTSATTGADGKAVSELSAAGNGSNLLIAQAVSGSAIATASQPFASTAP